MIKVGGIVNAVNMGIIRIRASHGFSHRIIDGQFCVPAASGEAGYESGETKMVARLFGALFLC